MKCVHRLSRSGGVSGLFRSTLGSGYGAAVARLVVLSGNGQVACQCLSSTLQTFQPVNTQIGFESRPAHHR
jgi:hypothetical protein